jgi:hypothetical protein
MRIVSRPTTSLLLAAAPVVVGIGIATAGMASAIPNDPYRPTLPPNPIRTHSTPPPGLSPNDPYHPNDPYRTVTDAFNRFNKRFETGVSVEPG